MFPAIVLGFGKRTLHPRYEAAETALTTSSYARGQVAPGDKPRRGEGGPACSDASSPEPLPKDWFNTPSIRFGRRLLVLFALAQVLSLATASARADGFDPFKEDAWSGSPVMTTSDPFDDPTVTRFRIKQPSPPAATVQISAGPSTGTLISTSPTATASTGPAVTLPGKQVAAAAAYVPYQAETIPPPARLPSVGAAQMPAVATVGCGVPDERPITELTINIQLPQGELPHNLAADCWQQLNATIGPLAADRLWPQQVYNWDATCFAHQPLYFEEINLERYGYGCCTCLQSAYSAAHFFATVPALPYCIGAHCPFECQYALGHYRPGSCPPWRYHLPPCSARGGISEAGALTGFIFMIP